MPSMDLRPHHGRSRVQAAGLVVHWGIVIARCDCWLPAYNGLSVRTEYRELGTVDRPSKFVGQRPRVQGSIDPTLARRSAARDDG